MSPPRRRILRSSPQPAAVNQARRQRRLERLRLQLSREQAGLARWLARLKRAIRAVDKGHRQVARIQKRIALWESSS
jgi:hypothetical protein